ncbi:hypothetical protein EYF80_028197 [Liparis tanakae]|uniref:Uncharacterized protein n=1 Tax=Liparis tanakae TaxID=230148 RepID=A0A4Z2H8K6_9TELE|nr:hypothetical protein EYF80_028197 [Liparis tanakae]
MAVMKKSTMMQQQKAAPLRFSFSEEYRYSHRPPPSPSSNSNSPLRLSLVVWEMCTLLRIPPDSILLATVTSVDQTSNCHLFWPSTPPSTVPEWTPTRMSTSVLVFSRTYLQEEGGGTPWFLHYLRIENAEAGEQFIEQLYELMGATGGGQLGEAHDVSKQDTGTEGKRLQLRHHAHRGRAQVQHAVGEELKRESEQVILEPLRHGHPQHQRVYPAGDGGEQQQRHQVQRQRQKAAETEKRVPARGVTALRETLVVQAQVAQHVDGDHQPQDVRHRAA